MWPVSTGITFWTGQNLRALPPWWPSGCPADSEVLGTQLSPETRERPDSTDYNMPMAPLHAYCDESGNTGANVGDPHQPVLAFGGWLFPSRISEEVGDLTREFLYRTRPQRREFHGTDLLKTPSGRAVMIDLLYNLSMLPSLPICVIAEKRYLVAIQAVDLFLAPESNPHVPDAFDIDSDRRRQTADTLYELPDETLAMVSRAHRSLDRLDLLDALRQTMLGLSLRGEVHLADALSGSLTNVDEIIAENSASRALLPRGVMATPNIGAFVSFFQFFEQLGRMSGVDSVEIIFDDSAQYGEAFRQLFEAMRDARNPATQRFTNGNELRFGLEIVREFRTAASIDEPLLQAADVLVSALCRYASDYCRGREPDPALVKAMEITMPEMDGERRLHKFVGSPGFVDGLLHPLQVSTRHGAGTAEGSSDEARSGRWEPPGGQVK